MTAIRTYTGTEDFDDAWEARETRLRLGAHHDGGAGPIRHWPAWSMAQDEQPPFRSDLAAARWAEDHDEDLNRYDDGGDE